MSEQTRRKKLAAGKKLLQEYQQSKCPGRPAEPPSKKKTKKGGKPKASTAGDCHSSEGAAQDPEPSRPLGTARAAGVLHDTGPHPTEDLERLALDASRIQNQQLCSEIQLLKQEKKGLQDQHGEENQKMACVQEALRAELEQHKLSIQMLMSEKFDLQSALAHMQQAAGERALEQEGLTSRLQAAQQREAELEMTSSADSTKQMEAEQNNLELLKALNRVKLQLQEKARRCEDLEDENTELRERLEALLTQKADMKIQIHKALEERAGLESQLNHMREVVRALQLERDTLAEDLRVESSRWEEKVEQLLRQMCQLREEREQGLRQVLDLESKLVELRKQLAELQLPQPPAGPSQAEQQLQAQVLQLQQDLKNLEDQLHLQVEENQNLRLQHLEQQQRLWILEKKAKEWDQHAEDRRKILETMEKEHESMRCMVVRNRELQEQLAQLQNSCHRLSAKKEALAGSLCSERQEKTTLQEKLAELEEKLGEWKGMAEVKSQEAEILQELRDQSLAQLQELRAICDQHLATNQQLTLEKEALQQHLQRQSQLLEQLEQRQVQTKLGSQAGPPKLQDTLESLQAMRQENEQLRAQLSFLAFPVERGEEEKGKGATPLHVTVPEDIDNPHTMWDFYHVALSAAESRKVLLSRQLQEQQARCGCLETLAAQYQRKLEGQALYPKRWNSHVSEARKQDTPTPKKKLHICFTQDLPDKVDRQDGEGDLQHWCGQLSEHISAMEEDIAIYKEQMAVLDGLHREKGERVSQLSQEKREKERELRELLGHLVGKGTECQDKMPAHTHTPASGAPSDPAGPTKTDVFEESTEPAQGEAGVPCSPEIPTTEHIVLLMPEQQPLEPAGPIPERSFPSLHGWTDTMHLA